MLVSIFTAFMSPVQAEISNDDVSISNAIEPLPNWNYDDSDIIYWTPQILVENQYTCLRVRERLPWRYVVETIHSLRLVQPIKS